MIKKPYFVLLLFFGVVIVTYLAYTNTIFQKRLKEIKFEEKIELTVNKAYNERGIYILNNKYYLNSATFIIGNNLYQIKDEAIWRPKGSEHLPRISDITPPFIISKKENNDTIIIEKEEDKILLLLSN